MELSADMENKPLPFYKAPVFRKRLRKALITLSVLAVLVGSVGIFIGYFYEDTVKSIIISQLNKRLNCKIDVREIEFSIFEKFPFASVHFMDATVYDAFPDTANMKEEAGKKTKKYQAYKNDSILMKAKDVYLQLSIWDMIFGKYSVQRVEVSNARIQLKVFPNGEENYDILKPSEDTVSTDDFSFDLQKLLLNNVAISYMDYPAQQDYAILAKEVMLKGAFTEDRYDLGVYGEVAVYKIKSYGENYFRSQNTSVDFTMIVDQTQETVTFSSGEINIGGMALSLMGYVAWGDAREELDLTVSGSDLPLQAFMDEIPAMWQPYISAYDGSGRFDFNALVKGSYAGENVPVFSANVSLVNGEISQKKTGITLTDVSLKASYTNGDRQNSATSVIKLSEFSARLKQGMVSGSFVMKNFNKPDITLNAKGSMDLAELHDFIQSDTISAMSGKVEFDLLYKGQLDNTSGFTGADFVQSTSSGTLKLSDANFEFRDNKLRFNGLNGNFEFSSNDVISKDFKGKIGNSDFFINGYFRNVLPYIFLKDERLQVNATFVSQNIDLDELLQYQVSSGDTVLRLDLSPKLDLNFNVNVRNFNFGKFKATDIKGGLKIRNQQILVSSFSFWAMDGRVSATGLIDGSRQDKLLISCDAHLEHVDIRKMFYQMNNFGQEHLRDEHLKGFLTANIVMGSVWSNTFDVDLSTIYANASITIENGELLHYAPIEGLSEELKNRNFSNIKFATLKTSISIKDQIITIPPTNIVNDAVDVDIYGTHTFDNVIDYHVSVLYAEILNNNREKQSEYGQIEDDNLHRERYFFRITGTTENPIYQKVDKKAYKENISTKWKEEKQNLKELLNKEFNWFKKDTLKTKKPDVKPTTKPGEKEKEQEFQLDWE